MSNRDPKRQGESAGIAGVCFILMILCILLAAIQPEACKLADPNDMPRWCVD